MAIKYVDLDDYYEPVTTDQEIFVDVKYGDGQPGVHHVFLGKEHKGSNNKVKLGKKADVKGQRSLISATVHDILEETNWTSILVVVTEGTYKKEYGWYKSQAPNHLDTVIYNLNLIIP